MMNIHIDKEQTVPIYLQIAASVRQGIMSGELPEGSVLPSERALAHRLGVHRNTVAKAYGELKAEGLLRSRQGAGYLIDAGQGDETPEQSAAEPGAGKRVNWPSLIKPGHMNMDRSFDDLFERADGESKYSLGSGIPQTGIYSRERVARDISLLMQTKDTDKSFFSPYKGDRELRQRLVSFLNAKGIRASAGGIQVLRETNQALSFLASLLVKPGDCVVLEEPVSPDAYRIFELAGARICGVPVDAEGMNCDALERVVRRRSPRLILINSGFHDPTGAVLSAERRRRILEISGACRVPVIEEDESSELVYDGAPIAPVKALDTLDNVIYLYSLSLTFIPGLTLAFVAADKHVVDNLSYVTSMNMAAPDWVTQKLAAMYLEDGTYYAALDDFRESYKRKREIVCDALDDMKCLGVSYEKPRGGVYIWCRLPEGVDGKTLALEAYGRGVMVMPGNVFYSGRKAGRDHVRISCSYETEERLRSGMELFCETLRDCVRKQKR